MPIGARNIQLQVTFPGAVSCSATIDLTTGAIIATSAAVAFAEKCLNGRWRVVMIASSVGAGAATVRIRSYNGAASFAGSKVVPPRQPLRSLPLNNAVKWAGG